MPVDIGPRIGIDGEPEFRKELNRIIQQARTLDSEMKAVSSSFDDATDAQDKLEAQTKTLNKQIDNQSQRVEMLEKALEEARKTFGDNATQTLRWEQALNDARTSLNGMRSRLSSLGDELEDVGDEFDDAADDALDFGDVLSANLISDTIINGIQSLVSGISDLAEQTKEYRRIMGSLEVSSERAGYSAEETAETYRQLYGVLDDEQSAATTTANLQALGLAQEDLVDVTNAAIGAWATYGDSLPIDGLAESINETIRAGQVTGNFADLLNWGAKEGETFGVMLKENTEANEEWNSAVEDAVSAEDYFNLALQECSTQAERTNLVLQLLADRGLADAGEAWRDNNKDLVEANEATADYQDTMSKLSKRVTPVTTAIQRGWNDVLETLVACVDESDVDELVDMVEDFFHAVNDDVLPVVKELFSYILDHKDQVVSAVTGIVSVFATTKAVSGITQFASSATNLMSVLAGGSKTLTAFSASLSAMAGPLTLIAGYVGAIVWAFAEWYRVQDQIDGRDVMNDRLQELESLEESYKQVRMSAYDTAQAELAQLDNTDKLVTELQSLVDANGNVTASNRERAEQILTQLNEATGSEYKIIEDQIQGYNTLSGSIREVTQARRADILLQAEEEAYSEAITNLSEAQRLQTEAYIDLVNKKMEIDREYAQYKIDSDGQIAGNASIAGERIQAAYDLEMETLGQLEEAYRQNTIVVEQYKTDIETYETAAAAAAEGRTQDVIDTLGKRQTAYLAYNDLLGETEEEKQQILQESYDKALVALDEYERQYAAGVEGYNAEMLEDLRQHAQDIYDQAEDAGISLVEGTERGIESKEGDLKRTTQGVFGGIVDWVKDLFNINSPSKVFEEIGEQNGAGFEIGMVDSMHKAMRNMQTRLNSDLNGLSVSPMTVPISTQMPLAGHTSNSSVSYGGFTINVYAAEGMDENALADAVMDRIQTQVSQKEAVFA